MMHFTDLGFLFILLPISVLIYYIMPRSAKSPVLLLYSALFYLLWQSPLPAFFMISNVVLDYFCVHSMWRYQHYRESTKRIFLLSIIKNSVIILCFGVLYPITTKQAPPLGVVVVCISSIYYVTQLYRGKFAICDDFSSFGLYCLFFGKLPYGPIDDPLKLMPQIRRPVASLTSIGEGVQQLAIGVAKKILLADHLAQLMESILLLPDPNITILSSWTLVLCKGMWLFFIFGSFGDIAQGLAKIFSINISRNVYFPLQARGIYEYIYRFNISISLFFEELFGLLDWEKGVGNLINRMVVVALSATLVGLWICPDINALIWALCMMVLTLCQMLIPQKAFLAIPSVFVRIVTALLSFPATILLLPVTYGQMLEIAKSLFGGGYMIYNSEMLHILSYSYLVLIFSILSTTSLLDLSARWIKKRSPSIYAIFVSIYDIAVMAITISFILAR